jgi:hypothetical protein
MTTFNDPPHPVLEYARGRSASRMQSTVAAIPPRWVPGAYQRCRHLHHHRLVLSTLPTDCERERIPRTSHIPDRLRSPHMTPPCAPVCVRWRVVVRYIRYIRGGRCVGGAGTRTRAVASEVRRCERTVHYVHYPLVQGAAVADPLRTTCVVHVQNYRRLTPR